jgi:hypothetical protein
MSNEITSQPGDRRNRGALTIQQRIQWLEDRLYWVGDLNRADLADKFEMSLQQASADIALYRRLAPSNILYDTKNKHYVRSDLFAPVFTKSWSDWLLGNGRDELALRSLPMERVAALQRSVPDVIISAVARAYRHRTPLRIQYQSMKSPTPEERTICPHAVIDTGLRWHIRAWDSRRIQFTDLVPSRILKVESDPSAEWVPQEADSEWSTFVSIVLTPAPGLTRDQRLTVEKDFLMIDGERVIRARCALVYYQLSAMNLEDAVRSNEGSPTERSQGVAVKNWADLLKYVV